MVFVEIVDFGGVLTRVNLSHPDFSDLRDAREEYIFEGFILIGVLTMVAYPSDLDVRLNETRDKLFRFRVMHPLVVQSRRASKHIK
jgi:hypothetical protein